jgi:hypothetical protein
VRALEGQLQRRLLPRGVGLLAFAGGVTSVWMVLVGTSPARLEKKNINPTT